VVGDGEGQGGWGWKQEEMDGVEGLGEGEGLVALLLQREGSDVSLIKDDVGIRLQLECEGRVWRWGFVFFVLVE
jgi:hypothetical protein